MYNCHHPRPTACVPAFPGGDSAGDNVPPASLTPEIYSRCAPFRNWMRSTSSPCWFGVAWLSGVEESRAPGLLGRNRNSLKLRVGTSESWGGRRLGVSAAEHPCRAELQLKRQQLQGACTCSDERGQLRFSINVNHRWASSIPLYHFHTSLHQPQSPSFHRPSLLS